MSSWRNSHGRSTKSRSSVLVGGVQSGAGDFVPALRHRVNSAKKQAGYNSIRGWVNEGVGSSVMQRDALAYRLAGTVEVEIPRANASSVVHPLKIMFTDDVDVDQQAHCLAKEMYGGCWCGEALAVLPCSNCNPRYQIYLAEARQLVRSNQLAFPARLQLPAALAGYADQLQQQFDELLLQQLSSNDIDLVPVAARQSVRTRSRSLLTIMLKLGLKDKVSCIAAHCPTAGQDAVPAAPAAQMVPVSTSAGCAGTTSSCAGVTVAAESEGASSSELCFADSAVHTPSGSEAAEEEDLCQGLPGVNTACAAAAAAVLGVSAAAQQTDDVQARESGCTAATAMYAADKLVQLMDELWFGC